MKSVKMYKKGDQMHGPKKIQATSYPNNLYQKIKGEKRGTNTPKIVDSVQFNLTLSGGEIDLSNPLSMSSYKEIQMGYKKLASTSSQRTTLISTHFPNLANEQDTMIFTHPMCLQCFPTQENSNQRPSTLKLPPLISQVSLSSSSPSKSTKNTYIAVFSCQNRVTFCQIVTRLVRTTQSTTNLILKTCPASRKSCHIFPKSCHDWTPCKTCSRNCEIVTRFTNFELFRNPN
ncbi:hypothetical protein MTR_8g071060 [Medicago truncatula]|uniref:Uncharacterized protein n=1 Tax=Medicago truncatula TaxID=3880 RepID=A0A072TSZ6_MEDTR|nr:hypothetical protein MTR_8g071060 [Medicago truncatula]